jgi:hypothetical protein
LEKGSNSRYAVKRCQHELLPRSISASCTMLGRCILLFDVQSLKLSATAEVSLLKEILEADLSDLRTEIAGTEVKSLRDKLKEKEEIIGRLIERLGSD